MSGLRATVGAAFAAALILAACSGGGEPDPSGGTPSDTTASSDAAESDTARAVEDTTESMLLAEEFPTGSPMPAVEDAGGIPPYPDAVIHNRTRRNLEGMRAFEAFSTDPPEEVVAFYEDRLGSWRRVDAEDTDVWVREPDQAAVTVSEWDWENAHPDLPRFLREDARTVIGAAWRTEDAEAGGTAAE